MNRFNRSILLSTIIVCVVMDYEDRFKFALICASIFGLFAEHKLFKES